MKKLYILIVALFTLLSLQAASTKLQQVSSVSNSKTPVLTTNQKRALELATQDLSKHVLHPQQTPIQKMQAKHSISLPQRTTNAVELDGGVFLVEPEYEAATGEWYVAVESHGYTFRICWYGSEDTFCGTYTMDDISMEYSWGWFQSDDLFYEIYFTDVNLFVSEQQIGDCLKQITLDATIVDTNDETYVLHIEHQIFTPKTTIESIITNTELTIEDGYFVLDGNNDELDVLLTVNAFEVGNFYTYNDLNLEATKISYQGVEQQLLKADLLLDAFKKGYEEATGAWGKELPEISKKTY